MDGLGAMERDALPACRRVQPNYVRALAALIGLSRQQKEPSLPFCLAAEGSTGAEVGRMGSSVLTVQTPQPALTTGLSVSGNPSALLLGGGCSSGALLEGCINCTVRSDCE